jgi:hypothetical protein
MILDNLFSTLGGIGTSLMMFAILAFVGTPAMASVACRSSAFCRMQPRGR